MARKKKQPIPPDFVRAVNSFFRALSQSACPFCRKPITDVEQVGSCVFAIPCRCRLGRGDANRMRKALSLSQD